MKQELYKKIDNNELTLQQLSNEFGDLILSENYDSKLLNFVYIEAILIWFYNNNQQRTKKINLIETDQAGIKTTTMTTKLSTNSNELVSHFNSIDRARFDHVNLDFLLTKINLTESVILQ